MNTLHIENTVRDFDTWKEVFDKFDAFRRNGGVRSYRVARQHADPQRVVIDLDFDDDASATAFGLALAKVWATPQSSQQLVSHADPQLLDVVETRTL